MRLVCVGDVCCIARVVWGAVEPDGARGIFALLQNLDRVDTLFRDASSCSHYGLDDVSAWINVTHVAIRVSVADRAKVGPAHADRAKVGPAHACHAPELLLAGLIVDCVKEALDILEGADEALLREDLVAILIGSVLRVKGDRIGHLDLCRPVGSGVPVRGVPILN